jgi:hypothetical protein
MLLSALNYLSNPLFFAGFSIVIGIAYVFIWVISLKELGKRDRTAGQHTGMRGELAAERWFNHWRRANGRRTVRVKVANTAKFANSRSARVTRANTRAA